MLQLVFCSVDRTAQAIKKPDQPGGNIEITFLGLLEDVVVALAPLTDFGGHRVKALRTAFRAGQGHVGDCPGDTAIAVINWVNGRVP